MGWAGRGEGLQPISDDEALLEKRVYEAPEPWYAIYADWFTPALDDELAARLPLVMIQNSLPIRIAQIPAGAVAGVEAMSSVAKVVRLADPRQVAVIQGLNTVSAAWDLLMAGLYLNGNAGASDIPFGAVPPYPKLAWDNGRPTLDYDSETLLPMPRGACVAVNLSIAPGNLYEFGPYDPWDPVNVATGHLASRFCVVVATGNYPDGRPSGLRRMNPWAEAPHVIAVGATTGEGAERDLADYSLIGDPGGPQPTVVADGMDLVDASGPPGTSFAAPRVTGYLLVLAAFVTTLSEAWGYAHTQTRRGIPLVGLASVDAGFDREQILQFRSQHLPGLPHSGIDFDVLASLAHAQLLPPEFQIRWSPALLRSMLIECAVPVADRKRHEVGFGYVGDAEVTAYLSRFGVADLLRLTGYETRGGNVENTPLGIPHEIADLVSLWRRSALLIAWDLRSSNREGIVTNFRVAGTV